MPVCAGASGARSTAMAEASSHSKTLQPPEPKIFAVWVFHEKLGNQDKGEHEAKMAGPPTCASPCLSWKKTAQQIHSTSPRGPRWRVTVTQSASLSVLCMSGADTQPVPHRAAAGVPCTHPLRANGFSATSDMRAAHAAATLGQSLCLRGLLRG